MPDRVNMNHKMPANIKDLLAPLGDMKLDFQPLYKAADTGFMALSRGPK